MRTVDRAPGGGSGDPAAERSFRSVPQLSRTGATRMREAHKRVQWVYSSTNNEELRDRYDKWAAEYDDDLQREFLWLSPRCASQMLAEIVPPTARVLDAGAGTGLTGWELARLGFTNMVAMDLSRGMLREARRKNVYCGFDRMVLGEPLSYDTDSFDAVIAVGVFTLGHAPADSFDELIRITRPGGCIVFSLRVDMSEEGEFKEKLDGLVRAGRWKLLKATDPFQPLPKGEPEVYHRIWAFEVLGNA
jgi:SAM-dependent methyltransferase